MWFKKLSNNNCESCGKELNSFLLCDNLLCELNRKKTQKYQIFQKLGVWLYPFDKVKKENNSWYIDFFNEPGSITSIEDVEIGHKISDLSLNHTPYWEVNFVDENKGKIYLTPIEPNPFITGIGAGGAILNEHDYDVFSGEYETKRIDDVLKKISNKEYFEPSNIAYILTGTVPVNFGPNGAQGGWYNVNDTRSNRSSRHQLSIQETIIKDAESLKKLGFSVPENALNGTINPETFNQWIHNGKSLQKGFEIHGEDWKDINKSIQFALYHEQVDVKTRNWLALQRLFNPENAELIHSVALSISKQIHPKQDKSPEDYDPYWYMKEQIILFAHKNNWNDVLDSFETTPDGDNRAELAYVFGEQKNPDKLLKMEIKEKNPKVLAKIHNSLNKINIPSDFLIDKNLHKYKEIYTRQEENTVYAYYAKELIMTLILMGNGNRISIGNYLRAKFTQ